MLLREYVIHLLLRQQYSMRPHCWPISGDINHWSHYYLPRTTCTSGKLPYIYISTQCAHGILNKVIGFRSKWVDQWVSEWVKWHVCTITPNGNGTQQVTKLLFTRGRAGVLYCTSDGQAWHESDAKWTPGSPAVLYTYRHVYIYIIYEYICQQSHVALTSSGSQLSLQTVNSFWNERGSYQSHQINESDDHTHAHRILANN